MSTSVEIIIYQKLKNGLSPKEAYDEIAEYEHLNNDELRHFLLNAGLYQELNLNLQQQFKSKKNIHWLALLELLGVQSSFKDKILNKAISEGIKSQNAEIKTLTSNFFSTFDHKNLLWKKYQKKLIQSFEKNQSKLFDKVELYKNLGLLNEEHETLKDLKRYFKNDPRLKKIEDDFSARWARHIIQKSNSQNINFLEHKTVQDKFHKDEEVFLNFIYNEIMELLKGNSSYHEDFALLFYFMGDLNKSISILNQTTDDEATDWLKVDILLYLNRFLDVLSLLNEFESKYSHNPETAFASTYVRAQAYWGLKAQHKAISIMQDLINVRPDYRSAQSFLIKWQQGRAS